MRSDNEKKSISKTIKISPSQEKVIMENANAKCMNFSEYVVDCAVHGNNGLTPYMAVKLQEMVNIVKDIADNLDGDEYMKREKLRQRANDLTEFFKPDSPKEKLNRLENNIGLFIEGGYDIWEYLK